MKAATAEVSGTLSLELADQIDRVCDRYEAALAAGQRPKIEDYLDDVTASGRSALLGELLSSELEWRRRRGERPTPEEYRDRFPAYPAPIAAAFERPTQGGIRSTASPGDRGDVSLRPGARPVPGYRLIERLGRGGFGEVWKAEAPGGVLVALKFVRLHDGQGMVERRALETIKGIRHPNLLALFGAWQEGDLLIIGMELADGTLMDRFHQAQAGGRVGIPSAELIEYLAEAAKGLDYLNDHVHALDGRTRVGVQHRDIKPQNILLVGGGVKVADFGLARLLDQSVTGHTGSLTPAYAAPEFFQNQTSDRSDQYSLAVTYCLLRGGRLPFTGGTAAMMAGHLHQPPDLTMVPEAERPVVAQALAKEPAGRWPSCRGFVTALRAGLRSDAPTLPMDAPGLPSDAASPRGTAGPDPGRPPPPLSVRRRRGTRVAALLATPLALGLALWGYSGFPVGPRDVTQQGTGSTGGILKETDHPKDGTQVETGSTGGIIRTTDESKVGTHTPEKTQADPREAAHVDQGEQDYKSGEFERAIVAYSEAIAHGLNDASVYNNRGNAYLQLGHFNEAITDHDRAIQLDSGAWESYFNRGNAYFNLAQYEHAVRDYTAAIGLNPSNSRAYLHRAKAYDQLGDRAKAESDRAQATRLESGPGPLPEH